MTDYEKLQIRIIEKDLLQVYYRIQDLVCKTKDEKQMDIMLKIGSVANDVHDLIKKGGK